MYKLGVDYKDFDGLPQRDVLEFNITETELLLNITILDEMETVQNFLDGPERDLTNSEKQQLVRLINRIVGLGFGVRSEDRKRFHKSEQILADFRASAVYDSFFMELFKDQKKFETWMAGVVPESLQKSARKLAEEQGVTLAPVPEPEVKFSAERTTPIPPTLDELRAMIAAKEAEKEQNN